MVDPDWVQRIAEMQGRPRDTTDYGVTFERLGNIADVHITGPGWKTHFSLSAPDAMDLRDEITAWLKDIGAE